MTSLKQAVVLVTGANRGIGEHYVREALARGASKVYASARNPKEWDDERIVPLRLDVTDPASIHDAAAQASDVTILINNAGISPGTPGLLAHSDEEIRSSVETNLLGPLNLIRTFAPVLTANEGDTAIIDMHSVLAWYAVAGIYSVTKAALWSMTNALRLELQPAGVQVVGVHVGWVDTAMAAHITEPKVDPADLVAQVFDTVEAGGYEVLADEVSVRLKAGLSQPLESIYPQLGVGPEV
ncbi:SDR family oxidoreductase [Galactobacter sp.]|uniref:SDR family oxidoreductase n=1 Tax=Galactobacter sp. TaxID=2676125 RepID=UPI0025BBD353|nr:SDR family oxidoreductase [Galactobacter sp.]